MSIGSNIKAARCQKGLSQEQLANMVGMTLGHISKIERNKVDTSAKTIREIAKALCISTDNLIFDESERGPSDDLRLLFEAVTRLPEDKKTVIREFLEAMVMKSEAENWIKK